MPEITALAHASVLVNDTAHALRFYRDVLGLKVNPQRPDLGYPGAWLDVGAQQIHLLELPGGDNRGARPAHGGRDYHTALYVSQLDALKRALEQAGVSYTLSKSGRRALFCRDPDGNALEFIEEVL